MSHGHELVESADACALPDGLRACAAEFVGGMTAISSATSSANADEHDPAAQTLTESARVSASVCAITAAAPRIALMPPPHCLPTDAIGGGGGRAVGAVDDLSMGGAEISYSAHHAQDMSANGTLRHHHDAHKPARRSAANQQRRRHTKGVAYMMNSALNEQQRQMGLQPSLDIKGLNDTQADNEGLGAGGECTGAGNERAGDGNAIAGAGIACAGAYTIAGMARAHEQRHWTPPAPSPYNLGDDDGGSRPSQWPADDPEYEPAFGPRLSRLLRSIGPTLSANVITLLRIAVTIVQEILRGV